MSRMDELRERFPDEMTLGEARDIVKRELREGLKCPTCTQFAKVYRRKLNSGMAVSLIRMWRAAGTEWQHVPTTVGRRSAEEGKLRYWGLIEEETERREDGGRAGYWRVTEAGAAFVRAQATVQSHAMIYDGDCLRLDGPYITIQDALGGKFSYAELMRA